MILNSMKILPEGQVISSGPGEQVAIRHCKVTQCVNSGDELMPGSVCCACLEAELICEDRSLQLTAGTEVELWSSADGAAPVRQGVFTLEKPTKSSDHSYKIIGYDRVARLDRDLSTWLSDLQWSEDTPYTLLQFAGMVCRACGVELSNTALTNGELPVTEFQIAQITGRQLMQWIGELACCFGRADANGNIELAWYADNGITIGPSGERYYYAGGLSAEDYEVPAIDGVQYRLVSGFAYLHPNLTVQNSYVMNEENLIWHGALRNPTVMDEDYRAALQTELQALGTYRPCKIAIPASLDIRAGDIVTVISQEGQRLRVPIMTKTRSGQRDTLECTGSCSRSSSTAVNNLTSGQTARRAVSNLSEQDILNKLNARWITMEGIGRVLVKKEEIT